MQDLANLYVIPGDKSLPNRNQEVVISFLIAFNQLIYDLEKGDRRNINQKKNNLKSYINRL